MCEKHLTRKLVNALYSADKLRRPTLLSKASGGTVYDAVYVLTVVYGAVCRSGRYSGWKAARATQKAIGCSEHPWKNRSKPLFLSPPSLDSLLFFISPRIGQVQQRVDNSRDKIGGMVLRLVFAFRVLIFFLGGWEQFVENTGRELPSQHRTVGDLSLIHI